MGSLAMVVGARIEIPLKPVPVTGQTLAVLLAAAALGRRRGVTSVVLYLGAGLFGLPVFAAGGAGLPHLLGPTGGYLIGFIPAAYLVGWLSERGWDRRVLTTVLAMLLGSSLIYLFGVSWLAVFIGWEKAVSAGMVPFLLGDFLKILVAALALPLTWSLFPDP